ncbi:MAG: FAD-binding protein [Firmicutes bacterium]|nr:FAD-binding protein [Bacillota bacterium]
MLKVSQVKIEVNKDNEEEKLRSLAKKLRVNEDEILNFDVRKQSIDARDKTCIYYVYEFAVSMRNEAKYLEHCLNQDVSKVKDEIYEFPSKGSKPLEGKIAVVGSGPAGLFAAYTLAENGYPVILIERGKKIEARTKDVEQFWQTGVLNTESNVQFGEGGAGTFSDGKLNTLVKDQNHRQKKVFETFVKFGAPKEILYSYKPHIGTDKLRKVIINMRNKLIKMGVDIYYESCLTDIIANNNQLSSIVINNSKIIPCAVLVLAIGHSARDTFQMLYDKNIEMTSKPFAVGIRVQHPQKMINMSQYGEKYANIMGAASYKLTNQSSNGRGVYSFCMCPGGFVVNASSEEGYLAINGMSNHARDEENACSAIIVTVDAKDYGNHPLDGVQFQRKLEQKAFELGNGDIPIQLLKDYYSRVATTCLGDINPVFKGKTTFCDLNAIFPEEINFSLKESMEVFGKKIKGFNHPDTIIAGVESRTSSPVKIIRDDNFESNIKGIYPCGEGAGYAGGITSAAIDGIKVAEAIGKIYFQF